MGRNQTRKPGVPMKTKLKKDPGVPRLPSLKQRNAGKQQTHVDPHRTDPDAVMASEPTLSSLAALAASGSTSREATSSGEKDESGSTKTKEQLKKHYIRALHKVIDESDIIILVLDARDPDGTRSKLVEEEVLRRESEGKKLVFVLNKIDLIPKDNAKEWLTHLRHTAPTLPFRSASNNQRSNLSSYTAPALMRLLKAYKPSAAQSVTIGVVGYPNVGKSSLINTLKRSKVCAVAAQAGHTKTLQTVQLERGLKIVDSPGVVFDEDELDIFGNRKSSILLRNVVNVEDVEDPVAVVEEIMALSGMEYMRKQYGLPKFDSVKEFLAMIALVKGRLNKGGAPDEDRAARIILEDWNHYKIRFFAVPPKAHHSSFPSLTNDGAIAPGAEQVGKAQILTEFGKAFDLGALFRGADEGAFNETADAEMAMDDSAEGQEEMETDEASNLMEADEPETTVLSHKRARSPSVTPSVVPSGSAPATKPVEPGYAHRAPKRLRRSHDIPDYHAPVDARRLATSNPMNRRMLKKAAKKARREGKHQSVQGSKMEIDEVNLGSTFFASPGFNFEVEA